MFKGTTTIELTDVNTGAVETYTDENMVTNALKEIFRPLGYTQDTELMYGHLSDISNLLGGLLCFDEALEENPDNLYAPATANTVACGVYDMQNTTTGTQRGHYNVSESVLTPEDGYVKYVWDFQTAQGNGTIHSVCLTSLTGGYCSYGSEDATQCYTGSIYRTCSDTVNRFDVSSYTGASTVNKNVTSMTVGTTEFFFALDPEQDVALYFRVNTGLQSISIIKRRAWLKSVSVFCDPLTEKPMIEEQEVSLSSVLSTTSNVTYNFDKEDSTLSIFTSSASTKTNGSAFDMVQINVNTLETVKYTVTNHTGVTVSTSGNYAICHNGFLLIKGNSSPYNLYKIEIGNWENVEQFTMKGIDSLTGTVDFAQKGRVYYKGSQFVIANLENMEITPTEHNRSFQSGSNTGANHYPIIGYLNQTHQSYITTTQVGNGYIQIQANYLATINNLTTPVTKTDDKTMKITYIIQAE